MTATVPSEDPVAAAGLRYSTDDRPGITRRRAGKGFAYQAADGTPIRDEETLERIRPRILGSRTFWPLGSLKVKPLPLLRRRRPGASSVT
jgi:hypothetical protein